MKSWISQECLPFFEMSANKSSGGSSLYIECFGESTINESTILCCFVKFPLGDFGFENEPRGRYEAKVNNSELRAILEDDTSQSTHQLETRFHFSVIIEHLK